MPVVLSQLKRGGALLILKRYRAAIITASVALVAVVAVFLPIFRVDTVRITGTSKLTEREVQEASGINAGSFFFTVFSGKAERAIEQSPYVAQASVVKVFPGVVNIHVTERRVCGYVKDTGNFIYIDAEGRVLEVKDYTEEQLPVIVGLKYASYTKGEVLGVEKPYTFNTVVFLSNLFRAYELENRIILVDVKNENDIRLYVHNIEIRMGNVVDANDKIRYLKEVLPLIPDIENTGGILDLNTGYKGEAARFKLLT